MRVNALSATFETRYAEEGHPFSPCVPDATSLANERKQPIGDVLGAPEIGGQGRACDVGVEALHRDSRVVDQDIDTVANVLGQTLDALRTSDIEREVPHAELAGSGLALVAVAARGNDLDRLGGELTRDLITDPPVGPCYH